MLWVLSPFGSPFQLLFYRGIVFIYAVYSLYKDIRHYYGWHNGFWLTKYTHWNFLLLAFYFGMSFFASASFLILGEVYGKQKFFEGFHSVILATTATNTLFLDAAFFRAIVDPKLGLKTLSPSSAHKHLVNSLWIVGDLLLCSLELQPSDFVFSIFFNIIYVCFAATYFRFTNKHIYPVLQMGNKMYVLFVIVGLIFALPVLGLASLRRGTIPSDASLLFVNIFLVVVTLLTPLIYRFKDGEYAAYTPIHQQ